MKMSDAPDLAEINKIVQDAQSGAAAVNRRITNAYHRLSEAARLELQAGQNLDWCGFAKWSSFTVGFDLNPQLTGLRIDEIANLILQSLPPEWELIRPVVTQLLRQAVNVEDGLVVKALRAGNAVIFREMGSIFVHLLERFAERRVPGAKSDKDFAQEIVDQVMSGPPRHLRPPIDRTLLGTPDERSLVDAIVFYLRAAREPDHRAELMLAGNMLFSVYEQKRADRLITIGLCAPVRSRLIAVLNDLPGPDVPPLELLLAGREADDSANGSVPKELMRQIIGPIDGSVISVLTETALVIQVADARVRLGHPELLTPQVIPTLPEVAQVMNAQASTAAPNWIDLRYRLRFIAKYFAAFQQKPEATREPQFSA